MAFRKNLGIAGRENQILTSSCMYNLWEASGGKEQKDSRKRRGKTENQPLSLQPASGCRSGAEAGEGRLAALTKERGLQDCMAAQPLEAAEC